MHTIVNKQILAQKIKRLDVLAPDVATRVAPGQFVMVTPSVGLDPIPLTVVDVDERRGVISLIIHEVGSSTQALGEMSIGDAFASMVGPLGQPALIEKYGLVLAVATGIGAAQILPICRALKKKGNKVFGIIGANSKSVLMLEAQMRVVCDELFIATDDGSYERRGFATQIVRELLAKHPVAAIYAIGTVPMMEEASRLAKEKQIPVRVTVSTYMVNGLGMCGSCRLKVADKWQLACVDGPQFDGHQVDFEDLMLRVNALKEQGCHRPQSQLRTRSAGLATLVKSLWGSPRK